MTTSGLCAKGHTHIKNIFGVGGWVRFPFTVTWWNCRLPAKHAGCYPANANARLLFRVSCSFQMESDQGVAGTSSNWKSFSALMLLRSVYLLVTYTLYTDTPNCFFVFSSLLTSLPGCLFFFLAHAFTVIYCTVISWVTVAKLIRLRGSGGRELK